MTERAESIDAVAACGLVALESSIHVTPLFSATTSMRWRPSVKAESALPIASCETPTVRAKPAAASALETLCGTVGFTSVSSAIIAASCGSETKARSTRSSSTTPISPGPGVSRE